ncbi:hypothetical protein [Jannaschia sp. CCS1]|uniref:hypothetical protein n=1 Tax=Jannaschia sp. (strain CCS1) TaxID=290400 RepID=UPI000053A412|nr:hypothetical protein [Jannaschia sp. CCS1]ABD53923.1 hypothetical protein Jann_1006 [Jannaschia sp. CCS1]
MIAIAPKVQTVAVIGTSNIGAVKSATGHIAKAHPTLDLTCFGLPGGKFDGASTLQNTFSPDRTDPAAMNLSCRVNGTPTLDLQPFDHIFVIGDTLGMPATLWTALNYDIADWRSRTGRDLLSLGAFQAAMAEAIAIRADHLRAQFADIAVHVALAPYPTTAVVPKGEHHQQPYAGMARHPHAAEIQSLYLAALSDALQARDMTLVPQPPETIASPFLTKDRYGIGALDFRSEGQTLNDHRHMNADFGASLFRAFAVAIGQ